MNTNQTTLRTILSCSLLISVLLLNSSASAQRPTTQYFYDANGNVHTSVDGLNRVTTQQHDALNRLRRITQPVPGAMQPNPIIQFDVNARDDLTRVIDPRNLQTVYTVNGLGDVTQQASPDTGTTVRTYLPGGQVETSRDARGHLTTYSYDELNRLTVADYGDGAATVYSYDQGSNGIGRLTGMSDPGGIFTAWSYTPVGRVQSKTQSIGSLSHSVSYSYNSTTGQMTSMTYPSGRVVTYSYGAASKDLESMSLDGTPIASSITYHPFAGPKSFVLGNGQAWSNGLDQDGRVTHYTLGGIVYTITWDAANRISAITHETDTFWNRDYGYDNLDRITSFASIPRGQSFAYDLTGNLTGKADVIDGGDPVNFVYSIAPTSNRMTAISSHGIGYSFDQAGNRTDDGRISFIYNPRGRLSRATITEGAFSYPTDYFINGLNLRVVKAGVLIPNGARIFVYDEQAKLIGEYDSLGRARAEHIWLYERPIAVVTYTYDGDEPTPTSTTISYVETDHLATPRRISNATQQTRWYWHSAPYGDTYPHEDPESLGAFTYNLRFPGQYFDSETNLSYNHHRDYEPTSGRYVQSDPIGLSGGVGTYTYAFNRPTSLTDPKGLNPLCIPLITVDGPLPFGDIACACLLIGSYIYMSSATNSPGNSSSAAGPAVAQCQPSPNLGGDDSKSCGDNDPCKGIRKQLTSHQNKLQEYINDPLAHDNRGSLSNAILGNNGAVASQIYEGRIRELRRQIEMWKRELEKCEKKHGR